MRLLNFEGRWSPQTCLNMTVSVRMDFALKCTKEKETPFMKTLPTSTAIDVLMADLYASYLATNKSLRADNEHDKAQMDFDLALFVLIGGSLNDLHSIAQSLKQLSALEQSK
jgi:hypothetical protein